MIADLKPYADYKESGQAWLGKVPEHWAVRRMKYVVHEVDSRSMSGTEQLLRVSQYTGVTQRSRPDGIDEPDTRADSLVGYKSVRVNDLVVNIMLAWNGSMGVSRYEGIASPAYCVYRFAPEQHPWYFHNLLRSPAYKAKIKASSTGVVESRLRLYSDELGRIVATIPPPNEQAAIVKFLDWANARLERAIRAKRKVIMLLTEQKQAIIHRAVTRGLDPSVSLKPSNVVGIGGIPKHWEERRLRTLTTESIANGVGESAQSFRADWPRYVRITDIRSTFALKDSTRVSLPPSLAEGAILRKGDILIAAVGATFGKAYVHSGNEEACFAGYLVRVRLGHALDPQFVGYWAESQHYWTQLRANVIQSTIQNFSAARVKRLVAVVPPIAEQSSIVAFLEEETLDLNNVVTRLEREIELLREHRIRLVADVVTGKLDVREAAARLTNEVPLGTIEDDADLGEDLDIGDEESTA